MILKFVVNNVEVVITVQLYDACFVVYLCYKTIAVGKDLRISIWNAKYLLASVGYYLVCA